MRLAVLLRRGERRTSVAASLVGIGRRGIASVIGGTVPGIFFRVVRRWNRFVDFSACFVVGFGAFIIGGASDIRRRSCIAVMSGVVPTLCCSCVGVLSWGSR